MGAEDEDSWGDALAREAGGFGGEIEHEDVGYAFVLGGLWNA